MDEPKTGAPPKELTLRAITKGPYNNNHQKWVSIAHFFSINAKRTVKDEWKKIPVDEFSKWTCIPEQEVLNAPLTKEFIDISLGYKAGEAQILFADFLPYWQSALDQMFKEGDYKSFAQGMAQLADIVKFKQADTGYLIPKEEQGPEEVIKSVIKDLEAIFGSEAVVQKIIPVMAQDDGATGTTASQLAQEPAQAEGDIKALPTG